MEKTRDAKDTRLNISAESSERILKLCAITKETHKRFLERLLEEEERKLQIHSLCEEDSSYIAQIIRIMDALMEVSTSYAKTKSISTQQAASVSAAHIEEKEKTIKLVTGKVEELESIVLAKDRIIADQQAQIKDLTTKIDDQANQISVLHQEKEQLLASTEFMSKLEELLAKKNAV